MNYSSHNINITSVVSALRLRGVLLEQPNQPNNTVNQTDDNLDKTPHNTKQKTNKTKQIIHNQTQLETQTILQNRWEASRRPGLVIV